MTLSIHPAVIDGIERPCKNCDTTNTHWREPGRADCQKYEPALFGSTPPAFDAILAKARELWLPHHYTSDLFRDYEILTGRTGRADDTIPATFLWAVYESGTHMVRLDADGVRKPGEGLSDVFKCVVHNFGRLNWFHWNGLGLVDVTPAEALELVEAVDRRSSRPQYLRLVA